MKKFLIILSVILITVVIITIMLIPKGTNINGVYVPREIIKAFEDDSRSLVFSSLCAKYNITDTTDFWNKSFPEGTAKDILYKKALERAEEYTIKLQLCWGEVDYKAILNAFENENLRLKNAMEKGEVIYGNTQYSLIGYLNYILSESEREYKAQYTFTDEYLLSLYESEKESFKLDDKVTVKRMSFPFYRNGQFDEELFYIQKKNAESFISTPDISLMSEYTFTFDDSKLMPQTYNQAMELEEGEMSNVISDEASFEIIYLIKREPSGYMDFEKVKPHLIRMASDIQFNEELKKASLQ